VVSIRGVAFVAALVGLMVPGVPLSAANSPELAPAAVESAAVIAGQTATRSAVPDLPAEARLVDAATSESPVAPTLTSRTPEPPPPAKPTLSSTSNEGSVGKTV
jgi:hypothetical protein